MADITIDREDDTAPVPPTQSYLDKAVEKGAGETTSAFTAYRKRLAEMAPEIKALGEEARDTARQMPAPVPNTPVVGPKIAPPPAPPQEDAWANFGSTASILGIIGSALLKAPVETALNASASAMKAKTAGDAVAYEKHYRQWKDTTAQAWKQAEWEAGQMKLALDTARTNANLGTAKLNAIATATNNAGLAALLESGDWKGVGEYTNSMAKLSNSLLSKQLAIETAEARKAYYDWLRGGGRDLKSIGAIKARAAQLRAKAETLPLDDLNRNTLISEAASLEKGIVETTKAATAPSTLSPASLDMLADLYLTTGKMPPMGLGGASAREAVYNRAGEKAAKMGATVQQIVSGQIAFRADAQSLANIQKMTDAVQSFENTMLANLQIARQLMEKGAGTKAGPVVNRWLQAGRKATGDPDVAAFNTALETAMDEYAKILSGNSTGGARITDAAREQTNEMLGKFDSPAAIIATIDKVIIPDAKNRSHYLEQQLATIKGRAGQMGQGGGDAAMKARVEAAGGVYDPGKYEYRINPATGAIQRKMK